MSELYFDAHALVQTTRWDDCPVDACASYIEAEYEIARASQPNIQGALTMKEPPPAYTGFEDYAKQAFKKIGFPADSYKWWISKLVETDRMTADHLWVQGFPHRHGWTHGRTFLQYIQAPEQGGETVIWPTEDADPVSLPPTPKTGVFVDGTLLHGVKPVVGKIPRLMFICTAFTERHRTG
jgi:hypothetical protein